MIPHSRPSLGPEEIDALARVTGSGMVAQWSEVEALEEELAAFLGVRSAVAVSSGTAGLHLSLLALGVKDDIPAHIPSYVCTALLNAVNQAGGLASVCDIDPNSGNIDVQDLRQRMRREGELVIVPHMFGNPAQVSAILSSGATVVEDCAQSIGAALEGRMTGTFGRVSVFSFYATKVLCAGEGGAVASDSEELTAVVRDLREYDNKPDYITRYNYKMTDIQAAMARVQLKKLPHFIERRRMIAEYYNQAVEETGFTIPVRPPGDIYFRYILFHRDSQRLISRFRAEGIGAARPVFKPIHEYLGLKGYPGTDEIQNRAISIPCYPSMKDDEVETVRRIIEKIGSDL